MKEIILGLTWLHEQGAVLCFKTGQLTVEVVTHMLLDGVDGATWRSPVVQTAAVMPSSCEMDVTAKTVYSTLKAMKDADGASWMTESGEAAHGIQVARKLVLNCLIDVPIRVMNVLNHPLT